MPPRGKNAPSSSGDSDADDDSKHSNSNSNSSLDSVKLITLTTKNYNEWEGQLKYYFYSQGWEEILDQADITDPPDYSSIDPTDKRRMYGKVGMSLSQEMIRRCKTVPVGYIIALLRHIKAQFYRNTTVTKNSLKASLIHCRLEDYRDIEGIYHKHNSSTPITGV